MRNKLDATVTKISQQRFTCSKSAIEILEKGMKYVRE